MTNSLGYTPSYIKRQTFINQNICRIAAKYGCKVTGIDLTEEFIRTAKLLSQETGLQDLTNFVQGNALNDTQAKLSGLVRNIKENRIELQSGTYMG
ncbi:hypothetical protein FW778_01360 [Ginsengibacter hankyongi]|uniref:Methyltransferase type 11 domain-containing protein n=1 Tax=Ginsengibacter hankyongi TaxID=2607284 RepID=A0A5J5IIG2_9BACT|nr:methyltransferase domain-containing protein [Ginsengibacter hankyongi]KAA9040716.1 hypothetical protein FW778_01360 [Ginsengibacter hankyongi]